MSATVATMSAVERFVAVARAQEGKPYQFGAAGPDAFDCSGLVAYCYQQATGWRITRSSYDQAELGVEVASGAPLLPGDVIYWGWGRADHVGIYIGNRRVINALNEQRGVIDSALDADYDMPLLGARRIFPEGVGPLGPQEPGLPPGEESASPSPSTKPPTDKDPALQYGDSNRHERRRGKKLTRQRRGGRRGRR